MADAHADRSHAEWSASATERNWNCAGALTLNDGVEDQTSVQADWGTVAHEIAEDCLFDPKKDASEYVGQTRKGKVHEIEVDDEMAETVMAYVDYCRDRVAAYKAETGQNALIFIEQNLPLDAIDPPFNAGGTGDFIAIFEAWHLIEVVDLKTGRGTWVDAKQNAQARTYALGTMLKFTGYDIDRVRSTIIQPRMGDGKPKEETIHISDLVEWTADLKAKMLASKAARDAFAGVKDGTLSLAEWASTYLSPGNHCDKTFCKARASCPALRNRVEDIVGIWFDDLDKPHLANVDIGDPDERARRLDMLEMIEGWIDGVRAHEHRMAETGNPATGYILVDKEGREKWNDGAEAKVLEAVKAAKLAEAKYLNPGKLRTPKQIRKELGTKADLVAGLSTTPVTGHNLVKASTTSRPPAKTAVDRFFEPSTN